MSFGKAPADGNKFYQGAASETPWTQHLHARMFIDEEDTFADMARQGIAPGVRARNPLDPYRKPDPVSIPVPPNIKMVGQVGPYGLRPVQAYRDDLPTNRKIAQTYDIMRDMNHTLGSDLADLKRFLLATTSRVENLERSASLRGGPGGQSKRRSKSSVDNRHSHEARHGGRSVSGRHSVSGRRKRVKPMKSALWDPNLLSSLPVQTPSTAFVTDRSFTYPVGPLRRSDNSHTQSKR